MRSMILAVLLVFVILTVQFKSIVQPFAILTTVPMAFIGVFTGLAVTGNEFGFYAFMGLVALVGIAVNDAIVLIDFMNGLRREGMPLDQAVVAAGKIRFNPVLATTMTTIGGVLPLAFREVYYAQFSFTLVFGLLVTTVMTLYFIPVTYHLIERRSDKKEARNEA
jgi:HAE1 family hydrophobic/amphiphilic exporter-1